MFLINYLVSGTICPGGKVNITIIAICRYKCLGIAIHKYSYIKVYFSYIFFFTAINFHLINSLCSIFTTYNFVFHIGAA